METDIVLSNKELVRKFNEENNEAAGERQKRRRKIKDNRFQIGLPSISDGQLLFLLNMVNKMKHNTEAGSRIAFYAF